MATFYQQSPFNNQNSNNYYNVIKLNSPQSNNYPIYNNTQMNNNINNQNTSPLFTGNLATIQKYSPTQTFNNNILTGNQPRYQTSTTSFNYKEERIPRYSTKQGNNNFTNYKNNNYSNVNIQQMRIQRSNTTNYGPRPSAYMRVGPNFYFKYAPNNILPTERRTVSNNYRLTNNNNNTQQIRNNMNNIQIVSTNQMMNGNQTPFNNNYIYNNFPNIQKINIGDNSGDNSTEIKNNENQEKKNEPNKNKEKKIAKVTKLNSQKNNTNNQLENNPILTNNVNEVNNNGLSNQQQDFNKLNNITQLLNFPNHQLLNDVQINRAQFSNSAHLPNTNINLLNNNNIQPSTNQPSPTNIQLNVLMNNYNNIPQDIPKTQEQHQEDQSITPFLTINGEILSNMKCTEYFRETKTAPVTSYGYSQNQNPGHRSYMEDEGRVIENFNGDPNKILFCIFDGHGGGQVSKFLQEHFGAYMKKIYNYKNYFIGFTEIFKAIDDDIKLLDYPTVGSTATIVYIEKDKNNKRTLYCANVGDSRCVLVSKKGCFRMSYDDKASDPKENERINKNGGIVVGGRVYGQLILSRSFGDWRIKDFGVIVDPHVTKFELNEEDLFCVIASDGVWDVLRDEECAVLEKMNVNTGELSKNIITECLKRKSFDNLSCFVISLN